MLNQYYSHRLFRTGVGVFFALGLFSFYIWYSQFALMSPLAWVPLLACVILSFTLVLFPTNTKRLPFFITPLILLIALVTLQMMLLLLPHNLTQLSILFPLLYTLSMCSTLILRDHAVSPWVLFALSMLLVLKWHLDVFISSLSIAAEFLVPTAILGGMCVFKHQIQQASHKARQSRILLQHAEFGREHEEGVSSVAAHRVQEVRSLTEDMLHRIAYNREPVTSEEINEFRFTEAQLRDTIRGRHIVNKQILEATMAARRRGAKVDILDERGEPLPPHIVEVLTPCAVDLLDDAYGGTITIRAFPPDDPTAVMLVHDGNSEEDEPSAIEIAQHSGEIERF